MAWIGDNIADYVRVADNAALDLPDGDFTLAGWIKPSGNSLATTSTRLYSRNNSGATGVSNLIITSGGDGTSYDELQFTGTDNDGSTFDYISTSSPFNGVTAWTHIIIQRSGATVTLYVNNSNVASGAAVDAIGSDDTQPAFGGDVVFLNRPRDPTPDRGFNGAMAEWAKWDRALSADEISALAKGFAPSFFPSPVWYVPMIRDYVELINGLTVTNSGTTVTDHPAIIYPVQPVIWVPEPVVIIEPDSAEVDYEADQAAVTAGADNAEIAYEADEAFPGEVAAHDSEIDFEFDHAQAVAAPGFADIAYESDEAVPGEVAAHDSEIAWEATEPLPQNVQFAEVGYESDQTAVTATASDAEVAYESDEAGVGAVDDCELAWESETAPVVVTVHNAQLLLESDTTPVLADVEDSTCFFEADEATFAGEVPVQSCEIKYLADRAEAVGFFRFATITARHDVIAEYPVTFVEIARNSSQLDPSAPSAGKYAGAIVSTPEVADEAQESFFGIRTKSDVDLRLSLPGGPFKVDGGAEIRGWHTQVWRRRRGQNEFLHRGRVSSFQVGHEIGIKLRDVVRAALLEKIPNRFITTSLFPNNAKDAGAPINIAVGTNLRIPCPNVEWDDLNRIYRHALGEGAGYGGGNWGDVTRVYREDAALSQLTGTVAAATSSTLTLETADAMPVGFLRYWFAEITGGTGAGQTRRVEQHLQERVVIVSPNWSPTPNAASTYRLREWRWYDGGQVTPYPGIALIEFGKPPADGSRIQPVYADAEALQAEKNFVRFIQSVLTNTVWGKGLEVGGTSFDQAAALTEIEALEAGGLLTEPRQVIEVLRELSMVRGIFLFS